MNPLSQALERLRGVDLEKALGLRPPAPPVALELDGRELVLVRVKRRQRGRPLLEAYRVQTLDDAALPASIFQASQPPADLPARLRELFEATGTRPGRVALVLPDNMAKVSVISLPEWPQSSRQLEQILRFKVRRAVPFRLDEASLSYQVLHADGPGVTVLVALVRRALLEQYEQALVAIGARPGLVDLCTPNLFNLCRERIEAQAAEGDVGLLNCAEGYFTLLIVREGKLIFFRCKSFALGAQVDGGNGLLAREVAGSLSYYQEKLAGQAIRRMFVRSVGRPIEEIAERLAPLGIERIEPIDASAAVDLASGVTIGPAVDQRIAAAVGAACGRGR